MPRAQSHVENKSGVKRVLVVDDHPITRAGIVGLINAQPDFVVCGEADGIDLALRQVAELQPDVITLDLTLGKESSLSHFDRFREARKRLLIVVLSMHDESTHGHRAMDAGADGYVQKDAKSENIVSALRVVLDGGKAISPRLAALMIGPSHRASSGPRVMNLSPREFEVYQLIGVGLATREIAEKLGVSTRTIEAHKENIKRKLGLKTAAELGRHAAQFMQGNPPPES